MAVKLRDPDGHNNRGKASDYGVKSEKTTNALGVGSASWFSGIDWLSMVTRDPETEPMFYQIFGKYKERYPLLEVDWNHQGGFRGRQCYQMAVGTSDKYGTLIKASGECGNDLFGYVARSNVKETRVTRIDLRLDIVLPEPDKELAKRHYQKVVGSGKIKYTLMENSKDGTTLYVGSMSSNVFGRLYDKGVESGSHPPGHRWRLEVVTRKPMADELYSNLLDVYRKQGSISVDIKDYVLSWFDNRGVCISTDYSATEEVREVRTETPLEAKLKWIEKSVSNSAAILADSGYLPELLEALGIGHLVTIKK